MLKSTSTIVVSVPLSPGTRPCDRTVHCQVGRRQSPGTKKTPHSSITNSQGKGHYGKGPFQAVQPAGPRRSMQSQIWSPGSPQTWQSQAACGTGEKGAPPPKTSLITLPNDLKYRWSYLAVGEKVPETLAAPVGQSYVLHHPGLHQLLHRGPGATHGHLGKLHPIRSRCHPFWRVPF